MQVAPIWFAAQLTFNFSLSMTNITSNTILSSTSSLFTFGLSCVLLEEKFTKTKLVSIVGCIIGEHFIAVHWHLWDLLSELPMLHMLLAACRSMHSTASTLDLLQVSHW